MAVIVSVPVASAVVVKDACPLELSVTGEPVLTPLTLNCTVPSGSPVPAVGATVAVIVTEALKVEGFAELDSVVVVAVRDSGARHVDHLLGASDGEGVVGEDNGAGDRACDSGLKVTA